MRAIFAILAAGMLTACAQFPKIPNFPGAANPPLVQMVELGGGGWQVSERVQIPDDVCNPAAYVEGYKSSYMIEWNRVVVGKANLFALQAKSVNRGTSAEAAHNLELYRGKVFNLRGHNDQSAQYGPQGLVSQDKKIQCSALSHFKGKNAGSTASLEAIRKLETQEH